MNKNAEKWIEALRSGKYKQTQKELRNRNGFCCLGVACEIYAKETSKGRWYHYIFISDDFSHNSHELPVRVREWLGLKSTNGSYYNSKSNFHESLINDNDTGYSFDEIADIIEKEPSSLFRNDTHNNCNWQHKKRKTYLYLY